MDRISLLIKGIGDELERNLLGLKDSHRVCFHDSIVNEEALRIKESACAFLALKSTCNRTAVPGV